MNAQSSTGFSYSFNSSKPAEEIFSLLLQSREWWSGLYGETIEGQSEKVNDEFSFRAGDGAHYSKQRLVELIPNKRIAWLVTESNLSFLAEKNEWANTKIIFDITPEDDHTHITFTHEGLVPKIECYDGCSGAWTKYMINLEKKLK